MCLQHPTGFLWSSEGALITHQAEGVEPSRAHAHDVGAHLAEEAALAVLKVRSFEGMLALF